MEGSLQKIIAAIVGVLILFIIPVYMAYEKVDDVSYSLALKITQNFVDNVRDRGYISPEMYTDFVSNLMATGNMYDIEIEHVKKRYDPAVYIYEKKPDATRGNKIYTLDYDKYGAVSEITINGITYTTANSFIDKAHTINEEIITDKQIVKKLFSDTSITKEEFLRDCLTGSADLYESLVYMDENSYILSEGDQVNVTVKNSSQTIASIFYSMFTANVGTEEIAKIYVNYGGTVKNSGQIADIGEDQLMDSEAGKLFKHRSIAQEVIVQPGKYEIQCWGASGGGVTLVDGTYTGGKGAYVKGIFDVSSDTSLYVYVGGAGTEYSPYNRENGGFNGGGNAYNAFGGGGASDVRLYKGEWDDKVSLLSRIIVAAGGGGSSKKSKSSGKYGYGGNGGNLTSGSKGKSTSGGNGAYSYGASSSSVECGIDGYNAVVEGTMQFVSIDVQEKGTLGKGGTVDFDGAGAGGSGYFGGSAAHGQDSGGGGGLSYIYKNEVRTKSSKKYPFNQKLIDFAYTAQTNPRTILSSSILEQASTFYDINGKFIGITNSPDVDHQNDCKVGANVPINPLGEENKNGCVIIRKID